MNAQAHGPVLERVREQVKLAKANLIEQDRRRLVAEKRREESGAKIESQSGNGQGTASLLDITSLVNRLETVGTEDAKPVIAALVKHGAAAIPHMRRALRSPSQKLRRRAPRVLAKLNAVEAIPDLVQLLDDDVFRVELHAVKALADLRVQDPALAPIFERYLDETDTMFVTHALRGLQAADPERAHIQCCALLSDRRPEVRLRAALTYEAVSGSALDDIVGLLVRDSDANIRMLGYNWLAEDDPTECLQIVLARMFSVEPHELGCYANLLSNMLTHARNGRPHSIGRRTLRYSAEQSAQVLSRLETESAKMIERLETRISRELTEDAPTQNKNLLAALAALLCHMLDLKGQYDSYMSENASR